VERAHAVFEWGPPAKHNSPQGFKVAG
jgi:hypothetical protein